MNLRLLKSTRVLKGIYQYELADKIGVAHKTYNFKENGRMLFTVDEILNIVECLNLTLEEADNIFFSNRLPKN